MGKSIAILCNYELLEDRVGGMDYFFWRFDEECKKNKYQVTWFFPNYKNFQGYNGLFIIGCEITSIEQTFLNYCNNENKSFDYIVCHFLELCTPFYKQVKINFPNSKIITVDHNPRPINGYPFKKKIEKLIKGFLYSKYIDLFVPVSKYTKNELINDFGIKIKNKIKVVYNGIYTDNYLVRQKRNFQKPTFLVACHLRESKGLQDLIEAVYLLPENIKKELTIPIYGDGPYKENLVNKINELKLDANFLFKGSVANLYSIYCQYDYLLQPTHMECFSLSILESLAANVPVITTNVGGNEEAVIDSQNGYIFKAKDVNKLAIIIEELMSGKISIKNNVSTAIKNNFSIEKMVQNHLKLLCE